MSPPKKNGNDPVTHEQCELKHGNTTKLLYATFGSVILVLGFGITSSILSWYTVTDVNDLKQDVREIRQTQIKILSEGSYHRAGSGGS